MHPLCDGVCLQPCNTSGHWTAAVVVLAARVGTCLSDLHSLTKTCVRRRVVFAEQYQVMRIAFVRCEVYQSHYVKNSMDRVSRSRLRLGLALSWARRLVGARTHRLTSRAFAQEGTQNVVHADEKLAAHTWISTRATQR
jgi:hypothetical protein